MDLAGRIDRIEALVESREPEIQALLPEADRFARLRRDARALAGRYPDVDSRPPLFGLLFGVKDIFHVDGWPTRAGSRLPPEILRGPQATSVSRLFAAGALMLGKAVTTELAYFTPGPTRNPHNLAHTPGGSSSGSAAAVAAGFCDVALGSQTIGSIVRPAAFCGIVGFKPTFDRIPADGLVACASSFDHVGVLARDVATATRAAAVLCDRWSRPVASDGAGPPGVPRRGGPLDAPRAPVLAIPVGPYLDCASAEATAVFASVCERLAAAGYDVRRVPALRDFDRIRERHEMILAAEAARVHASWFREHEGRYSAKMADLIRRGQRVTPEALERARAGHAAFRRELQELMVDRGIDAWICPSTVGPAPRGLESTGDPVMNLPWTQAGLPVVGLPARRHDGLPLGLQVVGTWDEDEALLALASSIEPIIAR